MDLLKKTKKICDLYDIKPTRTKGQNFLVTDSIYDGIIELADLKKDDVVLEVGPGLGFLTEKLGRKVKEVVTVELDDKLAKVLSTGIKSRGIENIEVVNMNVLDFVVEDCEKLSNGYKIVANLPYNITSVFLRKFLTREKKPKTIVLMLQKEVVERIVAKPGKMSVLAVSVQFYADAELVINVPKEDFWPVPAVDSAVIRIDVNKENHDIDEKKFFRLVKFGFVAKRKMMKNNLSAGFQVSQDEVLKRIVKAGFKESVRAQELSIDDWKKLYFEFLDLLE